MNAVVELEDLRKSFTLLTGRGLRRQKREVLAVDGIDLRVLEGESVAPKVRFCRLDRGPFHARVLR